MHQEVAKLLGAYEDGELNAELRAGVARHLAECPVCAQNLAALGRLATRLHGWAAPAPAADAEQAFWLRLSGRLPAQIGATPAPASAAPRTLRGFLLPLALVLGGAFVQAGALLTLAVSVLLMAGALPGVESWLAQLLGNAPDVSAGSLVQLTWPGWLASETLVAVEPGPQIVAGLEAVLGWVAPTLLFLILIVFVFLALSGWAGLRLSRRAGLRMKEN